MYGSATDMLRYDQHGGPEKGRHAVCRSPLLFLGGGPSSCDEACFSRVKRVVRFVL